MVSAQAGRLVQGLGDLMPHASREKLVRRLEAGWAARQRAPREHRRGGGGAGVEDGGDRDRTQARRGVSGRVSRRFLRARRSPIIRSHRGRSLAQLHGRAIHVAYPVPYRCALAPRCDGAPRHCLEQAFAAIDAALEGEDPPGAVIVEPIQDRAGAIVPPSVGFLPSLCRLARERRPLVIYDEILTGAGRTGAVLAWERSGPGSGARSPLRGEGTGRRSRDRARYWGSASSMEAWRAHVPPSGEAPHASTFYAHPLACAGALAAIERLTEPEPGSTWSRWEERSQRGWRRSRPGAAVVGGTRLGYLLGAIELVRDQRARKSRPPRALGRLMPELSGAGDPSALPGGSTRTCSCCSHRSRSDEAQLRHGLEAIDAALAQMSCGMYPTGDWK